MVSLHYGGFLESPLENRETKQLKSQFLANISHEIRTPLGLILGFTDLLLDPALSAQDRNSYVTHIRDNGLHLFGLLSEILDVTKIEAGQFEIEYSEISIADFVQEVVSFLEPSASAKGISIHYKLSRNLPPALRGDAAKMRQILIHLITNAIKFSEHGSVDIEVQVDPISKPAQIQFLIKDDGPGIELGFVGYLFENFAQSDSSMTRSQSGSGLGLALSQKLARALGGNIDLLATSPRGSTFRAKFPLNKKIELNPMHVPAFSPFKTSGDFSLDGTHILLVDDAPDNLLLIRRLLERAGARLETASNGQEGMEMALLDPTFDVVLMDMQMPTMSGYDATEKLREAGYNKPIIALTAHALKEDREKCLTSGCNDYLSKPIMAPLLIKTIQRSISPRH